MMRKYLVFSSKLLLLFISLYFLLPYISCNVSDRSSDQQKTESVVKTIDGTVEFKKVVDSAGNRLLMFDLYADWCGPCRLLSPLLEEIANENQDIVSVFKINVDNNPEIARAFNVSGIPYVVLMKNKQVVHAELGVKPKETYLRAINQFAEVTKQTPKDTPNGKIVAGVREIRLSTATGPVTLYVYQGETIKLIIEKVEFPYSIHIPDFNISKDAEVGKNLEVTFKAENAGVFPIFCNGKCPAGDGANYGQIIVMQYEAPAEAKFIELTAKEAKELIEKSNPLILDVRTPNEFY
jgi:thioredoxin 1